ncbi:MAG: hypothetical protein FWD62_13015 [Betaproteobacteria bacterium]|nr:hypothetical protein [Betaproteobacteria bacterium]
MKREDIQDICLVLISLLLPISILGLFWIGDRVYAAIFNAWKFYGYGSNNGIDIGVEPFYFAVFSCLLGLCVCIYIVFYLKKSNRIWLYRSAVMASVIYFLNNLLLLLLVSSGLAFLVSR